MEQKGNRVARIVLFGINRNFFSFQKNQKKEDGIFLYSDRLKRMGAVGFLSFLLLFFFPVSFALEDHAERFPLALSR